jgi:hypothetical protein
MSAEMTGAKRSQQGARREDGFDHFVEGREMTMTSGNALAWTLAAGMLLAGGSASAATCIPTGNSGSHTYIVNTAGGALCWDYDDGNVPPDTVNNIPPPVVNDDILTLPVGYVAIGQGAVNLLSNGTFTLNVTSSDPFVLFLKQADTWAAFLLGAESGTWSIDDRQGISHWNLYGNATTVVPIPPAALLLGSGLLGLIGIGRRRKSTSAAV